MDVAELLEQCRVDYLDDHTEMVSGEDDHLFSDAALVRWFNEGQRRFAAAVWVIESVGPANPSVAQITLSTGVPDYPLHPKVKHVHSAKMEDSEFDLTRADYNTIRQTFARYSDPDYFDSNQPGTATPGRPHWFATDIGGTILRVRPVPSAVENGIKINLRVAHLPLVNLSADATGVSPELPEEYHHVLALYAAGRALTNPNIDSMLRTAGQGFMREYERFVVEAKRDLHRFKYAQPRVRFGGWVNGC